MWPSQHDEARRGIGAGVLGACPPDEGDRIALDLELFARRVREAHAGQVAEFTSVLKGLSSGVPVPADLRIEADGDVRTAADLIQVAATPGGD